MVLYLVLVILLIPYIPKTTSNNAELMLVLNLKDHTIAYRSKCSMYSPPLINITISESYAAGRKKVQETINSVLKNSYLRSDPKISIINEGNITNLQQLTKAPATTTDCKGYDNFIIDIGIVSFVLGGFSSLLGIYTLTLSLIEQFISYISQYYISIPAMFFAIFPNITSSQPLLLNQISMVNTNLGILDTIVNSIIGLPLNDHINFASAVDEILGLISLCIGTWSTFPDIFEEILDNVFGVKVHNVFEGYGC